MSQPTTISELARRFPSLIDAEGIEPFDVERLVDWSRGNCGSGGQLAADFVAHIWNDGWPFNLRRAMLVWDHAHRQAALSWLQNPKAY